MKNAILASLLALAAVSGGNAIAATSLQASNVQANDAVPGASNGTIGQTPDGYEIAGVNRPMWGTYKHSMAYIARQNVYKGH
ncbi:exported hypothetical protein [Paraburkholderia tropica]|uniref:hypothetical protein n=1 Tax=Paraburkholderia tropica TaxID=92647 RepID=UPI001CB35E7C|nr:hypothetical protein [Paraburkholderia tropica]CAG9235655.1 exported hypothetical protein [Paraburkholderia tropica]